MTTAVPPGPSLTVVALIFSPLPSLRTAAAASAVLHGVESKGGATSVQLVRDFGDVKAAIQVCQTASATVFASPTYNAEPTWPLKAFLDEIASQSFASKRNPLTGKACATLMTGASERHYRGGENLRSVLSSVYNMQTLSPHVFLWKKHFTEDHALTASADDLCTRQGEALHDLASAVLASKAIQGLGSS
ncbi:hypothetical protein E4J89_15855 [Arthrobacter sp. CAU 1506]|uniref:NAD(P)H-dependent oxidoreductase n=1 Tax=Arthrobacter sp. CAU 1506 TaxID=2560052 RepID=UPI0010AC1B3E|nr:NAD(P)H-dependent oxidoreductase [Arthrobacter sp. CAU 1506]TJY67187.1 hypothetical protein E4J89_15855 [Arthrobacter sp. CAU 1506]